MSELKIIEAPQINFPKIEPPDNSLMVVMSEAHSEPEDSGNTEEINKRSLRRKRANSEDSLLHSIKNKSIKKRKNSSAHVELKTEKDVRKYYLNINKNVKVKPILLETIFEHLDESTEDEEVRKLGRATKRALNICDGFNINKSLTNKRKNLIKKNLGNRKKPKKIALSRFIEDFKKKTESLDSSD